MQALADDGVPLLKKLQKLTVLAQLTCIAGQDAQTNKETDTDTATCAAAHSLQELQLTTLYSGNIYIQHSTLVGCNTYTA